MPIRESERRKYPPPKEWKLIRARILARDLQRCKWCSVPNGRFVVRTLGGQTWELRSEWDLEACALDGERAVRIVLTVAHLDHDPANNADENLAALCQRCHLRHDIRQHVYNARRTRARKAGQIEMPFVEEGRRR